MLRYPLRLQLGATSALVFFAAALVVVGLASWRQESLASSVGGMRSGMPTSLTATPCS